MCGIVASFAYRDSGGPTMRESALAAREAMRARGPDGEGIWVGADQRICLAHRRLSILDLSSAGAQPMIMRRGAECIVITFNGEIYNYQSLRDELAAQGATFHSSGDTEVLLHLYARDGPQMVHRLRGMYAFVIWDSAERRMLAARDPFGIKPLYFSDDGRVIRFASQVKALLAGGSVDTSLDAAGDVGFHLLGYIPDPFTLYRGIRALSAGAVLTVYDGGPVIETPVIDVVDCLVSAEESAASPDIGNDVVLGALGDSTRAHLVADVDVGAFLSAGKDSSAVVALAARSGHRLNTITLSFAEYSGSANDEAPIAEDVAKKCSASHRTVTISRNDFDAVREALLKAMDQPTIDGVNVYFVARAAAQAGMKVALSGLGGDELFAGYSNFRRIPEIVKWFHVFAGWPKLGALVRWMLSPMLARYGKRKYASLLEYGGNFAQAYLLCRAFHLPWELTRILDPDLVSEGLDRLSIIGRLHDVERRLKSPRAKIAGMEMQFYMRSQLLRDTDWAGMAHSLEIRVPFVDLDMLRTIAPLIVAPRMLSKSDFIDGLLADLPPSINRRAKTGFSTPVKSWLASGDTADDLRKWGREVRESFKSYHSTLKPA